MLTNARFLCIGAHPDDVEFGCLGLLLKYGSPDRVRVVVLTAGEFGDSGRDRTAETREAFAAVGLEDVHVLGFQDGALYGNLQSNRQTVAAIERHVAEFNPTVVLFPSAEDTHQDHRAAEAAARAAVRMSAASRVTYSGPSTTRAFSPNLIVSIDAQWPAKLDALKRHQSQAHRAYTTPSALEAMHSDRRAAMLGCGGYVETFHVIEAWA